MIEGARKISSLNSKYIDVFQTSYTLLNRVDRVKIFLVTGVSICLAFLDLIAVTTIGVVSALTISGIQSKNPPLQIQRILDYLHLEDWEFQTQVAILGSIAATIMVTKTILSIILVRRMLEFLALKSAFISARLSVNLMQQSYEYIKNNSSQTLLFSVTQGVNSLVLGVIGSTVQIVTESCLILVMLIGLFAIEPAVSVGAFVYFALIALAQQRFLGKRAVDLGSSGAETTILANKRLLEALNLYREIYVRQVLQKYNEDFLHLRKSAATVVARLNFFPYINKYTLEISLVVGSLLLAGTQFVIADASTAITTLSIFLAAATRVSPSILRLQQSLIGIKSNIGTASPTLKLLRDIENESIHLVHYKTHSNSTFEVDFQEVSFKYRDSESKTIDEISFGVTRGEMVALIGPSGGGKSTIVDLMLGLLTPQHGNILIRGQNPSHFIQSFPGKVGYVAQDASLIDGSIRYNLTFGLNDIFEDEVLFELLDKVALREFVEHQPQGLNQLIGERGLLLSGGQRQRLNLARAILTNPEILILDEATSALDVETEQHIIKSIENIRKDRTIVIVAHRLSTVLKADNILFIKDGRLHGQGKFDDLRKILPDFNKQAKLAGYGE